MTDVAVPTRQAPGLGVGDPSTAPQASPAPALEVAVHNALGLYLYDDAIFLAERLVVESNTDETRFLLGTCYYRSGHKGRAANTLQKNELPEAIYLYCRCLMETNTNLPRARALLRGLKQRASLSRPLRSAVFTLLGNIAELRHSADAPQLFALAAKENPYCLSGFQRAAKARSSNLAPAAIFDPEGAFPFGDSVGATIIATSMENTHQQGGKMPEAKAKQPQLDADTTGISEGTPALFIKSAFPTSIHDSFYSQTPNRLCALSTPNPGFTASPPRSRVQYHMKTKRLGPVPMGTLSPAGDFATPGMQSVKVPRKLSSLSTMATPAKSSTIPAPTATNQDEASITGRGAQSQRELHAFTRRSAEDELHRSTVGEGQTGVESAPRTKLSFSSRSSAVPSPLSGKSEAQLQASTPKPRPAMEGGTNELPRADEALAALNNSHVACMRLLGVFASGAKKLATFDSHAAIDVFSTLPPSHQQTYWVHSRIGQAYFQLADYEAASKSFSLARRLDGYGMENMDLFSTVLWLLQSQSALAYLAHDLLRLDIESPITWCVMGNNSSLQKDHERAVKYFERAIQLDPQRPYSYTLLGHECFHSDNFQRASSCFLNALKISPRHYNALYGLAELRFKQEQLDEALTYMKRAVVNNPNSPALLCELAKIYLAKDNLGEATRAAQKAALLDPTLPIVMHKMAQVYKANKDYKRAVEWAKKLAGAVPKEAGPHYLLAKLYEKLGDHVNTAVSYEVATALDPQNIANDSQDDSSDESAADSDEDESDGEFNSQRRRDME